MSEVVTDAVLHASVTPAGRAPSFDLEFDSLAETPPGGASVGGVSPGLRAVTQRALRPGVPAPRVHHAAAARRRIGLGGGLRPGPAAPPAAHGTATDEGGRGLYLVEQLATRWGSRPTTDGKAVWFEIPLDNKHG